MTVTIGRPINGISLNGLEYLLDAKNEPMMFKDEATARQFLKEKGVSNTEAESYTFEKEGE